MVSLCYRDKEDGALSGLAVDVMNEIARRLNSQITVSGLPFKRIILNMERGQSDITSPIQYIEERTPFIRYLSTPIISRFEISVYGRNAPSLDFSGVDSFYGKNIGLRRGIRYSPALDKALESGTTKSVRVNTDQQLLAILEKGRVDFIIMPNFSFEILGEASEVTRYGSLEKPIDVLVGVSKKGQLFPHVEQIDQMLRDMQQDGTLTEFRQRHSVSKY
ncbi:transporter substrate-binding domain-containing protein [Vibrio profundum]|uniref:substrate-binding periplasmic protein n=1 Tax=Vibrio profundum TaxID=2910247 RepID=UPI003D0D42D4